MKLWILRQTEKDGYDTFDSVVVAAENEEAARNIHPDGKENWGIMWSGWCKSPEAVTVSYLGEAAPEIKEGVVLASFNAG